MEDGSNVIRLDFHDDPEGDFRSLMVDVFKRYFATQTESGFPTEVSILCMFEALATAVEEMPGPEGDLLPGFEKIARKRVFTDGLQEFVESKYGGRIMHEAEFNKLRDSILAEAYERWSGKHIGDFS